ncbi:UDPGT domain-containing protein [Cephalotus follicularis]|uniref:Glycosyltransferase n=1 Tax=Cephalotus follicularis TaxID=3775 RepID=A0A1Q3BNG1_CEPFO|nr:UDPGT domain-containing protein [Cephalotus follicularis]
MHTLGKAGPINLSNLITDHYHNHHKKLSCIINNSFVPWVADVASKHGIPCAMLWIQPCSLYAIYYRFYNKLNPFPTLTNPNMNVELPGMPLLLTEDLPSFVLPSNPFDSFTELLSFGFQNMRAYKWVLGNSFFELEKDAIESMAEICPIRPVGPLVPPSLLGEDQNLDVGFEMWKTDDSCIDWLNNQPASSIIFVSFGSIVVLSAKQMEAIATALKNSNRSFIWVVKRPEFPSPNREGELPQGFIEETKSQGLIVSWSPQTKVLAHPALACFITHCGWNSMLETMTAGVPVIAYPQWTDQPTNAKLVTDVFSIGLRLRPNQDGIITSEEVERCVKEIFDGPKSEELKKKAAEWKAAAREAVGSGGSSDRNIQLLVDEIVGVSEISSSVERVVHECLGSDSGVHEVDDQLVIGVDSLAN